MMGKGQTSHLTALATSKHFANVVIVTCDGLLVNSIHLPNLANKADLEKDLAHGAKKVPLPCCKVSASSWNVSVQLI